MDKRLFAIGDIHGCFNSLHEMVENKIKLQKRDKLILLGDYIDRGYESKEVIDFIMGLLANGYDVVPLMGNHEAMLLDAYKDEENIDLWLHNGAIETLKSFKIRSLYVMDQKYIKFFNSLKYFYSYEDFLFVHAGFNDDATDPFADHYTMMWKCRNAYHNPLLQNKTIIHGHKAISVYECEKRIRSGSKVIDIDTGCVYKHIDHLGKLTAIDCYTLRTFVV